MAIAPSTFLRFAADHSALLLALFERAEVDEAELLALIDRHHADDAPSADHVRRQLEELSFIERSASAETVFELGAPIRELLAWLTHHQRLSSATVLRGYLDDLDTIGRELEQVLEAGDPNVAALALKEVEGTVERLRALSSANRETIVTEAQELRSTGSEISAVVRFQKVRRLWEGFLEPLRQLVDVQGEIERRLQGLRTLLDEGERKFTANGVVHRAFGRTIPRLARLRRTTFDDHHASVREVAPLYGRLHRESRWVLGASLALRLIRSKGLATLALERRLTIAGWRTRFLMSDVRLRARLAGLIGYRPAGPAVLAEPPPPPPPSLVARAELHKALRAAAPVDDVLAFVLSSWPDLPLGALLRAYGHIVAGEFGPVEEGAIAGERTYESAAGRLLAWPLRLSSVTP